MFPPALQVQALHLLEAAAIRDAAVVTAESCTGGLIAGLLTEIPGSSAIMDRGFVTYSNEAKIECLGVDPALIETVGAVSREVAEAMAIGALARSRARLSVSVTGIAGPGGGSPGKPVGLVHMAVAGPRGLLAHRAHRYGDVGRQTVRLKTVQDALELLHECLKTVPLQQGE